MGGWAEFILAFTAFFFSHSMPLRPALRRPLTARLGARGFGAVYSGLSIVVLIWLIGAAGRAPFVGLWTSAVWQAYVPLAAMLVACLILSLSLGRPNPLSFGGARNAAFDPAAPGLVGRVRHPVLLALALWSASHLVPNGDLAHVILFATFAVFALLGGRLIDRRKRREMGQAAWQDLVTRTRNGTGGWGSAGACALRIIVGLAAYALLFALHPVLLGVSPLG